MSNHKDWSATIADLETRLAQLDPATEALLTERKALALDAAAGQKAAVAKNEVLNERLARLVAERITLQDALDAARVYADQATAERERSERHNRARQLLAAADERDQSAHRLDTAAAEFAEALGAFLASDDALSALGAGQVFDTRRAILATLWNALNSRIPKNVYDLNRRWLVNDAFGAAHSDHRLAYPDYRAGQARALANELLNT